MFTSIFPVRRLNFSGLDCHAVRPEAKILRIEAGGGPNWLTRAISHVQLIIVGQFIKDRTAMIVKKESMLLYSAL